MGELIFLNTWLDIPDEKRREHDLIQTMISENLALFHYETRLYNPFQKSLAKERSHNLWRDRIHIVKEK
jgi:hypothetical protein